MISKRTVLVLGAGASKEFGFPLGSELRRQLCRRTDQIFNAVVGLGLSPIMYDEFVTTLQRWRSGSVDLFLTEWPQYAEIGKAAMAACLIPCERPELLFYGVGPTDNWYEELWHRMDGDDGRFADNNLSVVTFNYDRSFEYYMRERLWLQHGKNADAAQRDLKALEVVHVYGSLGTLPPRGASEGRHYQPQLAPYDKILRLSVEGIDTIGPTEPPGFTRARELLADAERVVFLGFGFLPENVARLGLFDAEWDDGRRARTEVVGTAQGFDDDGITRLRSLLRGAAKSLTTRGCFAFVRRDFDLTR